jgi:prepilin-type N-terminal cleavage/methylation domain-containing protein
MFRKKRTGFTLVELLVVIAIIAVLIALLLPAIQAAREAARRNSCTNKMHQIGIALQNHHDTYRYLPMVSTSTFSAGGTSGSSATGFGSGYSWLVKILPYLEETTMYATLSNGSSKFATTNNAGTLTTTTGPSAISTGTALCYTIAINALVCPSYPGDSVNGSNAGISNYVAISSTDMGSTPPGHGGMGEITPAGPGTTVPIILANGTIIPNKGLNFRSITDGTSKTVIACETKEDTANSWVDGAVNWVVGANASTTNPATIGTDAGGFLIVSGTTGTTAINVGPLTASATGPYYRSATWKWGPSSQHNGGVVMHVYADASVHGQTEDIDPTTYIQLITRAGRESVIDPSAL